MKIAQVALHLPVEGLFNYLVPEEQVNEVERGKRVEVVFNKRKMRGFVVDILESEITPKEKILNVVDKEAVLTDTLIELGLWMSRNYGSTVGEALNCIFPLNLNPVEISNFGSVIKEQSYNEKIFNGSKIISLCELFNNRVDMYIEYIKEHLKDGAILVIFPEIRLTPILFILFWEKVGNKIELWHSGLRPKDKYKTWFEIKHGKVDLCIGTRSCIFLPFHRLGTIIIDEDTEKKAYKETHIPKYDLLKVAIKRAMMDNAKIIIGNSMLSIESYIALKEKKYIDYFYIFSKEKMNVIRESSDETKELVFPYRMKRETLPQITVIDMTGRWDILPEITRKEIEYRLARNEQIVIFHNRKGFSASIKCIRCGNTFKCKNCNIVLVYYAEERLLKCSYCGYEEEFKSICKRCGVSKFRPIGSGIQKVEQKIRMLFPQAKLFLLFNIEKNILDFLHKLKENEIDILLTTNIIHRYRSDLKFYKLGLLCFVDIDAFMYFPKYNATEMLFYTIMDTIYSLFLEQTEIAEKPQVLIQTHTPHHYLLESLTEYNLRKFYEEELNLREKFFYPPFSRLILLSVSGKNIEKIKDEITCLREYVRKFLSLDVRVSDIFEPYPFVRKKVFKNQILLKIPSNLTEEVIGLLKLYKRKYSTTKINIDVDPVDL